MSDEQNSPDQDFYVGYLGLPKKDRRFLLKAIPLGLLGLAGGGALMGRQGASEGGGRWETGTPVSLTGRLGFYPYPTLWVGGVGIVLVGIGKRGTEDYTRPYEGQTVTVKGIKIVRGDCFLLGVAEGDITQASAQAAPLPAANASKEVSLVGEVLDAQCFMGIMNPGYGRTHRACAAQCIRGGQPVYFSLGTRGQPGNDGNVSCAGVGFVLTDYEGKTANSEFISLAGRPISLVARQETIGNLSRITPIRGSVKLLS